MKTLKWSAMVMLSSLTIGACQNTSSTSENANATEEPAGIDLADMDTIVSPAEDFYRFANGGWLDRTEIPADEGRWSSFNELREENNETLLNVLNNARESGKYKEGSDEMKAFTFYQVAMDSSLAEKTGVKPLQPILENIEAISNKEELRNQIASLRMKGINPFFGMYVYTDRKQSDQMVMHVNQGGLGLPNRDYYLNSDSKSKEIRDQYLAFVEDMLGYIGYEEAEAKKAAQEILELETELARASMDNVERRDPEKTYNKFAIQALDAHTPNFTWSAYFGQLGVADEVDSVVVGQPLFLKKMNEIIGKRDLATLKDYLKWNVINEAAAYLNHEIVNRNFEFYGKVLQGTEEMRPRWKRALASTNDAIGFAVGKLYVDEVFPPEAKEKAQEMVEYIKEAFSNRINKLEWMSAETKEKAQKKLSKFNVKIGYPNKWESYDDLEVSDSYINNILTANVFHVQDNLSKLGEPVDKDEWFMTPQTVNAYYSPTFNEIVFPAGILQPPFYNFKADAAVNFGGIGAVIGHEISHGFDDSGSRYNGVGNMKNWWTEEDYKKFEARTSKLASQYSAYEPLDSVFVNGKFTLGENIGDLGGVAAAYDGLLLYLEDKGNPGEIQGFTPQQRFFISWATIWRSKYKDESLRNQIMTDPHSPGMYRATGPLVNIDGFFEAFNIQEGDPMYKPDSARVRIW